MIGLSDDIFFSFWSAELQAQIFKKIKIKKKHSRDLVAAHLTHTGG